MYPTLRFAKIEADHELAQRLQAEEQEELSDAEKATLFQQLLEKRRKHFAAKRAEDQRNKPPTQAQQRKIMCTCLKSIEGKKLKDLMNKSFDSIQKMFDRAFKRVNTFVDFRTDLVEDKDTAELQSLIEVILDEEEVAIDVVPLAIKSPSIVGWKIHKEGKKNYYQIMRANGKSQMHRIFSHMLKSFSREDLEDLYKYSIEESTRLQSVRMEAYKVNAAEGVNAASEEVSTAELVSTAYLKEFDLLKWDQQVVSELVALRNFARRYGSRFCTHGGCIQSSHAQTRFLSKPRLNVLTVTEGAILPGMVVHHESRDLMHWLLEQAAIGSDTELDKMVGYGDQLNESDSEVINSVFNSRSSDGDDNQTNDRFKKGNEYHAVPPPLTRNYMPPLADLSFAGLDDSRF
ncbi:hypothetical protein Tco_0913075 [Tanacetum coccineum]